MRAGHNNEDTDDDDAWSISEVMCGLAVNKFGCIFGNIGAIYEARGRAYICDSLKGEMRRRDGSS